MKGYKVIYGAAFLLMLIGSQMAYSQNTWKTGVDTFKFTEGEIVDNTIVTMLDSAFTFLRLPAVELDLPYYYSLYIGKDKDTLFKNTVNIDLSVTPYIISDRGDLKWFGQNRLLLNYKGVPILMHYDSMKNDTLTLRYIKPTSKKSNFYLYYKQDKNKPEILYTPTKWSEQTVRFIAKKKYWAFTGYTLHIIEAESLKTHH